MTAVHVVIADDHRLFRRGIAALLATVDGIEVVGEAADGEHAVQLATSVRPDVVLMDLHMPGGPGLDAVRRIRASAPEVHTLVLTMFDDDDSVFAALRAGARGYVLKDADGDELVRSILTVARGGALYGASVAARLSEYLASPAAGPATGVPFGELTPGEHRVLEHIARGLNNDAIAAALGYSPKTVRNYVSIIFAKLQVTDRAQAIVLARRHGLQ
jgi:DNA-binding NarL/FixJ family response regulator